MDIILALLLFSQLLSLCILAWGVLVYIRLCRGVAIVKNIVKRNIKMDLDALLFADELAGPAAAGPSPGAGGALPPADVCRKRSSLATRVSGGFRLSYRGKNVTPEMVDVMSEAEVEELHTRMEARIGAAMCKSTGSTIIRLYTNVISPILSIPPEKVPDLAKELKEDPLVDNFLQNVSCWLYSRFGPYLAPLSGVAITAKYCDWDNILGRSQEKATSVATELERAPQVNTSDQ
jgi:hypothetical protein